MSEISDMLRDSADDMERNPGVDQHLGPEFLRGLTDRIDTEMAELPRGKDGKPIHVGETVYGEDGKEWHVEGITLGRWARYAEDHVVHTTGDSGQWRDLLPEWLTNERPDSLERIADEIAGAKNWCDRNGIYNAIIHSISSKQLDNWADRIRRLAKREDAR